MSAEGQRVFLHTGNFGPLKVSFYSLHGWRSMQMPLCAWSGEQNLWWGSPLWCCQAGPDMSWPGYQALFLLRDYGAGRWVQILDILGQGKCIRSPTELVRVGTEVSVHPGSQDDLGGSRTWIQIWRLWGALPGFPTSVPLPHSQRSLGLHSFHYQIYERIENQCVHIFWNTVREICILLEFT